MFTRSMSVLLAVVVAFATSQGQTGQRPAIQWKLVGCTTPLMLPEGLYDLSQFGKGSNRIDVAVTLSAQTHCSGAVRLRLPLIR